VETLDIHTDVGIVNYVDVEFLQSPESLDFVAYIYLEDPIDTQ